MSQEHLDFLPHQLTAILSAIADGVTAQDKTGRLVYANETAAALFGYPSPEALLADPVTEVMQRFEVFRENGDLFPTAQLPSSLALQGLDAPEVLLKFRVKATGEERWSLTKAKTVFDAQGEVLFAVNTFHDVTALKKSEERTQLLQQVASAFSQAVTVEDVATVVIQQGLATFQARAAVVAVLTEDKTALEVISAHNVPAELRTRYHTIPLSARNAVTDVVRTGEALWIETLEKFVELYPHERSTIRTTGLQAAAAVPLIAQGYVIGALGLSFQTSQRFTSDEQGLIQVLAQHCGHALERARLYQQAQETRNRFEVTLSSIGDAVIATDTEARVTFLNPIAEALTGWTQAEAVGRPISEVFHIVNETTRALVENPVDRVLETGTTVGLANHTILLAKDGRAYPIDDSGAPIRSEQDEMLGVVLVFRDVSERKEAEKRLEEREAQLNGIVSSAMDAIISVDEAQRIVVFNKAAEGMFGVSGQEVIGERLDRFIPQALRVAHTKHIKAFAKRGVTARSMRSPGVLSAVRAGGEEFPIEATISQVTVDDKRLFTVIIRDITERVEAEKTLEHERELLQKVFDYIPVMIVLYDSNANVLLLNHHFTQLTGWTTEAAHQVDLLAQVYPDPEYREQVREFMQATSGEWRDIVIQTRDGGSLASSWANIRLADDTLVGIGVDIRERQLAEVQLRQRLAQLQAIYELSSAVSRADMPEEVYTLAIRGLVNDMGADRASLLLFDSDGVMRFKAWHGLSDAYRRQTEGHSPWLPDAIDPRPILIADVSQSPELGELRTIIAGEGIGALAFIPLVSESQLIGKFMIYYNRPHEFGEAEIQFAQTLASHIALAIERKAIEQTRIDLLGREQQARVAAEKANALKLQFLAMISHELRTPLTSIKGFTSTLLAADAVFAPEQQREFIEIMDAEADKLKELVEQLIDLSSLEAGNLRIMATQSEVANIIRVARTQLHTLTQAHSLALYVAEELPPVIADDQRIAQVLVNLVGNATKYSPPNTSIILAVRQTGEYVQFDIIDEGYGIPEAEQSAVFEAFRQGNRAPRKRGAGLGLAICKGIVEAHRGKLWISATSAAGTTMSFTLPVVSVNP